MGPGRADIARPSQAGSVCLKPVTSSSPPPERTGGNPVPSWGGCGVAHRSGDWKVGQSHALGHALRCGSTHGSVAVVIES